MFIVFCWNISIKNKWASKFFRLWNAIGRLLKNGCLDFGWNITIADPLNFPIVWQWSLTFLTFTHPGIFSTLFCPVFLSIRGEFLIYLKKTCSLNPHSFAFSKFFSPSLFNSFKFLLKFWFICSSKAIEILTNSFSEYRPAR